MRKGAAMKTATVGEKLKNIISGKIYQVKLIGERMVVLESEDRLNQILATMGALKVNYERIGSLKE